MNDQTFECAGFQLPSTNVYCPGSLTTFIRKLLLAPSIETGMRSSDSSRLTAFCGFSSCL